MCESSTKDAGYQSVVATVRPNRPPITGGGQHSTCTVGERPGHDPQPSWGADPGAIVTLHRPLRGVGALPLTEVSDSVDN